MQDTIHLPLHLGLSSTRGGHTTTHGEDGGCLSHRHCNVIRIAAVTSGTFPHPNVTNVASYIHTQLEQTKLEQCQEQEVQSQQQNEEIDTFSKQ
jgi:hypothetical protein